MLVKTRVDLSNSNNNKKSFVNNILNNHYYAIFYLVFFISLFCNIFTLSSPAIETHSFAVYYFENLTGRDEWNWLERGLPDMLSQAFSQSERINYIPLGEIEKLPGHDLAQGLAMKKDLSLFHSLDDLLQVDLIFTGYFSLEQRDILKFNLIMYQSQFNKLSEFQEITLIPEVFSI